MSGSKQVDHWTSGTVYECSEIAGSPHIPQVAENFTVNSFNYFRSFLLQTKVLSRKWHYLHVFLVIASESSKVEMHQQLAYKIFIILFNI
jgi:hypothetical protein